MWCREYIGLFLFLKDLGNWNKILIFMVRLFDSFIIVFGLVKDFVVKDIFLYVCVVICLLVSKWKIGSCYNVCCLV